jgi:hypothetical protein
MPVFEPAELPLPLPAPMRDELPLVVEPDRSVAVPEALVPERSLDMEPEAPVPAEAPLPARSVVTEPEALTPPLALPGAEELELLEEPGVDDALGAVVVVLELLELAGGVVLGAVLEPTLLEDEAPGRVASLDFGALDLSQALTASAIATAAATRVRWVSLCMVRVSLGWGMSAPRLEGTMDAKQQTLCDVSCSGRSPSCAAGICRCISTGLRSGATRGWRVRGARGREIF